MGFIGVSCGGRRQWVRQLRSRRSGARWECGAGRAVKVVQFTDVHFLPRESAPAGVPSVKELFGLANLYIAGRANEFDADQLVSRMMEELESIGPDVVVFSGDLTSLGSAQEFERAARVLEPMLARYPTVMIAGNHDRYTESGRYRMEEYFGKWMRGGRQQGTTWLQAENTEEKWPAVFELESELRIVALDQARPSSMSNGEHSSGQLSVLRSLLQKFGAPKCLTVGHYPIYDPWALDGGRSRESQLPLYDRVGRSLKDVGELHAALLAHPPAAYLCGHHHAHSIARYRLPRGNRSVLQVCCGNTGYVGHKEKNRAGFIELDLLMGAEATDVIRIRRHEWNEKELKYSPTVLSLESLRSEEGKVSVESSL